MREINDLLQKIRNKIQNPREELPEEIFLFATEITPMVNVDLLIMMGEFYCLGEMTSFMIRAGMFQEVF